MEQNQNKFLAIIEENQIDKTEGQTLVERFSIFVDEMATIKKQVDAIKVVDISQVEDMKKARELRLMVKNIRVNSEKVRKTLKEDSLKRGKVIDALAAIVKDTIGPIEEYLESQEKFAENLQTAQTEARNSSRLAQLVKFADPTLYNYKEMSDEVFNALVAKLEADHLKAEELKKKAQVELEEKKRLEKEENDRIRLENEKLKKEANARAEKELQEQAARQEQERLEEKKRADEKAENDRKIKEADDARKKAEKELADKKLAEEKEEQVELEKERQVKLLPEKDKLFVFAESIKSIASPEGLSQAGLAIVKDAEVKLLKISQEIKESIKNL